MGWIELSHTNIVKILSVASLVIVFALLNTGCMSFSRSPWLISYWPRVSWSDLFRSPMAPV